MVSLAPPPSTSTVAPPDRAVGPAPTTARLQPRRDVFVDAVRAVGTTCVVVLHWLMAEAAWDGRTLQVGNALGHGWAWVLTWVGQALPLLFFAAGAAAAYERAAGVPGVAPRWPVVVGRRVRAVVRPVAAFAVAWAVAVGALLAAGVPHDAVLRLARMAPQLLWFLGLWVVLLAVVPMLQAAWRRWRWRVLAVAVALPLGVDLLRFTAGADRLAWANLLLVWTVPFLAGIAYATDRAARRPAAGGGRAALALGVLAGLAAMVLLVVLGPYPPSMVGMPGDAISNLGPPTAPVVAQAVAQVCAVVLLRPVLVRWARSARGGAVVRGLARRAMTVYLWHLTAMFTVVGVVLVGMGHRLPEPWSADWWASLPTWFAAYGLVLAGLVALFGRFERHRT